MVNCQIWLGPMVSLLFWGNVLNFSWLCQIQFPSDEKLQNWRFRPFSWLGFIGRCVVVAGRGRSSFFGTATTFLASSGHYYLPWGHQANHSSLCWPCGGCIWHTTGIKEVWYLGCWESQRFKPQEWLMQCSCSVATRFGIVKPPWGRIVSTIVQWR